MTKLLLIGILLAGFSGGELLAQCQNGPCSPCLTPEQRSVLRAEEDINIRMLFPDGRAGERRMPPIQGTLIWPMKEKNGLSDRYFKAWYVSNQVDLNPLIDTMPSDTSILDYNCGMRSYDNDPTPSNPSGYNHDGTDIVIYPYPYTLMNEDGVEAIAAATGVIVAKRDTNVDRNCVWGTGRLSNNLTLLHEDGTRTRYVHLKQFSLTDKMIGDTIVQGEFVGIIGSSGNSTIPHLHFEVENQFGQIVDPFFGPCSDTTLTNATWWADQVPYVDSTLNHLSTYTTAPGNPGCDMSDSTGFPAVFDERTLFAANDSVWMSMYFTHVDENDTARIYVRRPNSTIFWESAVAMPGSFRKSWEPNYFVLLGANPDLGLWEVEVVFMGQSFTHNFIVADCVPNYILAGNVSTWQYWQAQDWILSTSTLLDNPATNVTYKAGDFIELPVGFEVEPGARFKALLAGCGDEGN